MNKYKYLIISIIGNSLGTALMAKSELGLTSWGASALNFANYINVSLGQAFVLMAVFFYILSKLIERNFDLNELLFSSLFALSFGFLVDVFMIPLNNIEITSIYYRLLINIFGLIIMGAAISIHVRINIALHPMDIYLRVMQFKVFNDVTKGAYFVQLTAFVIIIFFGTLNGFYDGVHIGTVLVLLFYGLILGFFDKVIKLKL